ncbi:MAG TPA: response regulator [Kofleriaceae bacterium]|nr:response regulator [Kofleriaceae bacterium]
MAVPNRVLVVDDDVELRETFVDVLAENGFEAIGAADGIDALLQLRDPEDRWALVLLDLMMPNMDGRTFRREQMSDAALASIPVVILSAATDVADVARGLDAVAAMTKPVRLVDLIAIVSKYCPR